MIIQENDFLRTYNEMTSLWEEADPDSTGDRKETFTFKEVIDRAINDRQKIGRGKSGLSQEDIAFWCDLRYLLNHKQYSVGRKKNRCWYTRFLTFYRAYNAETAIVAWLNKSVPAFTNCKLQDPKANVLHPDTSHALPDIKTDQGTIECKDCGISVTIHEANFVARHTAVDLTPEDPGNNSIRVCLVGDTQALKQVFGEDLPSYVYAIDTSIHRLWTGFENLPVEGVSLPLTEIPENLKDNLAAIDRALNKQTQARTDKIISILDQQTAGINNTIERQLKMAPPETKVDPEMPLDAAIQNLRTSTTKLIKGVRKKYSNI